MHIFVCVRKLYYTFHQIFERVWRPRTVKAKGLQMRPRRVTQMPAVILRLSWLQSPGLPTGICFTDKKPFATNKLERHHKSYLKPANRRALLFQRPRRPPRFWKEGMHFIVDSKSRQIYRLSKRVMNPYECVVPQSPLWILPRTLNLAVQSAQSDAAVVPRLVKGGGAGCTVRLRSQRPGGAVLCNRDPGNFLLEGSEFKIKSD